MKRRIISFSLLVIIVMSCIVTHIPKSQVYAAAETEDGYTQYTFLHAGIADNSYTDKVQGSLPILSWDKVEFVGNITMTPHNVNYLYIGDGQMGAGDICITYGHGSMTFTGACSLTLSNDQNKGFTLNEPIELRLKFDVVDDDIQLNVVATNGQASYTASTTLSGVADTFGKVVTVYTSDSTKPFSVSSAELPKTEYTELTFRDWGLTHESVTGQALWSMQSPIASWDKVAVEGSVIIPAQESGYIVFGADRETDDWTGLKLYYNSGERALVLETNGSGLNPSALYTRNSVPESGTEVSIRLTFDEVKGNLQVGLSVNGGMFKYGIIGAESYPQLGHDIIVYAAEGQNINYCSATKNKKLADVAYNIEEEAYILTAATSIEVNGEVREIGTTLERAGNYTLKANSNGVLTEQLVSLYILGDVNLSEKTVVKDSAGNITDGIVLDAEDVTELKKILNGEVASGAACKAADLNNDDAITNDDLKLLQDIVDGKKSRNDVLDGYYPESVSFEYLGGSEVMPIAGYYGPKTGHITDEIFKDIKDSGINLINYSDINYQTTPHDVIKSLELAEKHGIGMFVSDAYLNPLKTTVNADGITVVSTPQDQLLVSDEAAAQYRGKYSYYDSYLGNFIYDEPTVAGKANYAITETDLRNYKFHSQVSKQMNRYANTFGYINNAAAVWFKRTGNTGSYVYDLSTNNIKEYEDVIAEITENTDVKVLSFDRYMRDVDEINDCARFMLNLDIIRKQAIASEVPFWAYVPTGGNWTGNYSDRIPTESEFYWEVNMNLAFGAKGIQYFTLVQPNGFYEKTSDLTSCGILNANYEKNTSEGRAWYTYVQNANKYIKKVDEILMKSDSLGVMTTGGYAKSNTENFTIADNSSSSLWGGTTQKSISSLINYSSMTSSDGVQRVTSIAGEAGNNYGVLAGAFRYQGKVALYLVNWDTTSEQDIQVKFNDVSNYRVISATGDSTGLSDSCKQTVAPGGAFLVLIDEENYETTTQAFDDISQYRKGTYSAPELDGYVFAGWYTSEETAKTDYDYSQRNSVDATELAATLSENVTSGAAYAKYVDASILNTKIQLKTGTTIDDISTSMRLVTTTNSLVYDKIGFEVRTPYGKVSSDDSKVYRKIKANDGEDEIEYTPDVFDEHSEYFATITLTDLRVAGNTNVLFTLKAYWKTVDGTKVYGNTRTFTLKDCINNMANISAE